MAGLLSILVSSAGLGAVGLQVIASATRAPATSASNAARLPGTAHTGPPLAFEPNVGQTAPQVRFLTHDGGAAVFLSAAEATWAIPNWPNPAARATGRRPSASTATAIRMQVLGGDPHAVMTAGSDLPGVISYFMSGDRAQWHTGIPTYDSAVVQSVYAGVDMIWHGSQGALEYDFRVAPGTRPEIINLRFQGDSGLSIDDTGALVIQTSGGVLRQLPPRAYQSIGGVQRDIASHFVLRGPKTVAFAVSAYDTTLPLVIDPSFGYSTFLGGTGGDYPTGIAVDAAGSAYVTGQTGSLDFPVTPGAYQTTSSTGFVTKLNSAGSGLVYSTYFPIASAIFTPISAIAVDSNGDAVVATSAPPGLPTTPGAFQSTNNEQGGALSAYVAKLDPFGSSLLYATYLGGTTGSDQAFGVALTRSGTMYVSGTTGSPDFPTTPGTFEPQCPLVPYDSGCDSAFVATITPLGHGASDLAYSTFLGGTGAQSPGTGPNSASSISVDGAGVAYVTGTTNAPDFPTTPGAFQTQLTRGSDECRGCEVFATKLRPAGRGARDLLYSTYVVGATGFTMPAVAHGPNGRIYVTGNTLDQTMTVTPGAFQTTPGGCASGDCGSFLTIVQPGGHGPADLAYSSYLDGSLGGGAFSNNGIAVDAAGDAYLASSTESADLPTKNPLQSHCCVTTIHSSVGVVAKVHPAGRGTADLVFSTLLGGNGASSGYNGDFADGVAIDNSGDIYVTGVTNSPGQSPGNPRQPFPTTKGAYDSKPRKINQGNTGFVTKITHVCRISLTGSIAGNLTVRSGQALCLDGATVSGSVQLMPGGDLGINNSTIGGGVGSNGATSVTVCNSSLGGPLAVQNSSGFVFIGDVDTICLPNTLQGVSLSGNQMGIELGGNHVTGNVTVNGTTGTPWTYEDRVPEIEANAISGNLDCNANAPAPTYDHLPNTVSGTDSGQCVGW